MALFGRFATTNDLTPLVPFLPASADERATTHRTIIQNGNPPGFHLTGTFKPTDRRRALLLRLSKAADVYKLV